MKKLGIAVMAVGAALAGWVISAPVASAECMGTNITVLGNGGGRCDHPSDQPDGSFMRCESVTVFGIGGTNCYRVAAGTP